ncbi:MAG: alpha/beta hydrolase-fold protein [Cyclobacteriaceae bacterium]|nr:alpha/beta hydrolase-fold protein [Cyclobacteriaceae bacterium]
MNQLVILFMLFAGPSFVYAQSQVPVGEIHGPLVWHSKIYPGTARNYWIYVPKQYDPSKPACLMVVQDGLSRAKGWNLPAILDSLIAGKEIPVMIGIFVDHGTVASANKDYFPRYNRSFEYDALGDRYARFLLEELIPEVERSYNLSTDPNDRSIAGASSGAICAFNVAWERPDQFRRVLSTIGTYVGLRGGDEFSTLVRKTEAKPLRIFLEDGTKDLNIYGGDWWMANQNMLSALTYAGYEVNHAWGEGGGHDSRHAVTIMGEAVAWLWKDYPVPVKTHIESNARINLLLDGEPWKEINLKAIKSGKLTINKQGEVFFTDGQSVYRIDNQEAMMPYAKLKGDVGGISFNQDGALYAADLASHKIILINEKGVARDVVTNVDANFMTISNKGIYFTDTRKDRIGLYGFAAKKVTYTTVPFHPTGLALSSDQSFLNVSFSNCVFGYSYKILESGTPDFGQAYIHYQVPYGETAPGASGMTVDSDNLLYTATTMGLQVSDQLGRVNFIFSKPAEGMSDVKLAGVDFNTIYVSCNGKLFSRKINAKGVQSWLPAVKPPKPGL